MPGLHNSRGLTGWARSMPACSSIVAARSMASRDSAVLFCRPNGVDPVAGDRHVDPEAVADVLLDDGRFAGVEVLRRAPPGRVVDVPVRGIRGVTGLVHQIPQVLWPEIEDLGGGAVTRTDGALVEVELGRAVGLGPVGEVQVFHAVVAGGVHGRGEYLPPAVGEHHGRVLDRDEVVRRVRPGVDQWPTGLQWKLSGSDCSAECCGGMVARAEVAKVTLTRRRSRR